MSKKEGKLLSKRGQYTAFVLIGIVLLVVFLIVIYSIFTITEFKLKDEARNTVDDYLQSTTINYYVYSCMDSAVKESINEWALQGGVYYDYQNGPFSSGEIGETHIPMNWSFPGRTDRMYFNVSYAIKGISGCPIVYEQPPDYPHPDTKLEDLYGIYTAPANGCIFSNYRDSGFFGLNNFSKLCYPRSHNTEPTDNLLSYCNLNVAPNVETSMEDMIAKRIANRTDECINFTIFQASQRHNITVLDEPVINITYDDNSFSMVLEYPFEVKIENKEPVLIRKSFEYSANLRITKIQKYLISLLRRETQDIEFNIAEDYADVAGYDGLFMNVSVINFRTDPNCAGVPGCTYEYDSILILKDNKSTFANQALTVFVGIKNRRPALDYIHETPDGERFDIVVSENDTLTFEPIGGDPENMFLNYYYYGWKETRDEVFDYKGEVDASCNLANRAAAGSPFTLEELYNCLIEVNHPGGSPNNWTKSDLFMITNKDANYSLNRSDIGPHNLTIITEDEAALRDWQTIDILVVDRPKVDFKINRKYSVDPGVPEGVVSREDPFEINASGSIPSMLAGGSIYEYFWQVYRLDNTYARVEDLFEETTLDPIDAINIPRLNIADAFLEIQQIHNRNFTHPIPPEANTPYEIKLTLITNSPLAAGISGSDSLILNVTPCLPHTSADSPYPYSTGNPYESDHACCYAGDINDWTTYALRTPATICYTEDKYGGFKGLENYYQNNLIKGLELSSYDGTPALIKSYALPSSNEENDIYSLTFDRQCDGVRGNICAGDMTAYINHEINCPDISGPDERCVGPTTGLNAIANNPIATCTPYPPGQSFELNFNYNKKTGGTADGFCDSTPKCSSLGDGTHGDGGPMICEALCDGVGGCDYTEYDAAHCYCSKTDCNAECDLSTPDYEYDSMTYTCKYGCDLTNTCQYLASETAPCDPGVGDYCKTAANRCVYNIRCGPTGINYDTAPGICAGACTNTGSCV